MANFNSRKVGGNTDWWWGVIAPMPYGSNGPVIFIYLYLLKFVLSRMLSKNFSICSNYTLSGPTLESCVRNIGGDCSGCGVCEATIVCWTCCAAAWSLLSPCWMPWKLARATRFWTLAPRPARRTRSSGKTASICYLQSGQLRRGCEKNHAVRQCVEVVPIRRARHLCDGRLSEGLAADQTLLLLVFIGCTSLDERQEVRIELLRAQRFRKSVELIDKIAHPDDRHDRYNEQHHKSECVPLAGKERLQIEAELQKHECCVYRDANALEKRLCLQESRGEEIQGGAWRQQEEAKEHPLH